VLWRETLDLIAEEDALYNLFQDNEILVLARSVYEWLKEILPYRCGVRLGDKRITFLIGNYRPAALKKYHKELRLDMGFKGRLPEGWKSTSSGNWKGSWHTIDDSSEGWLIVKQWPLNLSHNDVERFIAFCEEIKMPAAKTKKWDCNISSVWQKDKCCI
jgi:hypothetical protein